MARWADLPPELGFAILKLVRTAHKPTVDQPYLRAGYASMGAVWQAVFEPENFARISLDQHRISRFQALTSGSNSYRRRFVKLIRLHAVFGEYDCCQCSKPEDWQTFIT